MTRRPDPPAAEAWSGDALEAARLGRDLALSGIAPSLLEQVAEVIRLAGVQAVAALGASVLRDPWAGRVLAAALGRAAAADSGLAHDRDVVRWLKAAAMVMASLEAVEAVEAVEAAEAGSVSDPAPERDRAPGPGGGYGDRAGATDRERGTTPERGRRHG